MPRIDDSEIPELIKHWEEDAETLVRRAKNPLLTGSRGITVTLSTETNAKDRIVKVNAKLALAAQERGISNSPLDAIAAGHVSPETMQEARVVIEKLRLLPPDIALETPTPNSTPPNPTSTELRATAAEEQPAATASDEPSPMSGEFQPASLPAPTTDTGAPPTSSAPASDKMNGTPKIADIPHSQAVAMLPETNGMTSKERSKVMERLRDKGLDVLYCKKHGNVWWYNSEDMKKIAAGRSVGRSRGNDNDEPSVDTRRNIEARMNTTREQKRSIPL